MNYLTKTRIPTRKYTPIIRKSKERIIYNQGDASRFHFEVTSGIIRTTHLFIDGRRQVLGFFFKGEPFGTDQDCYQATAEVVSDNAEVRRTCWGDPTLDERALNRGLRLLENSILLLGRRTALNRLAAFLADIQFRTGQSQSIVLPMSRIDIADYLRLTTETVSRTFSKLVRDGIVSQPEHHIIRIMDQRRLDALAGADSGESDIQSRSAKP